MQTQSDFTLTLDDLATAEQAMQLEGARNQKRQPQNHFVKAKTKTLFDTAKKISAILDSTQLPRNAEGEVPDNGDAVVRIIPPALPKPEAPAQYAYNFDPGEATTGRFDSVQAALDAALKDATKHKLFENMTPGEKMKVYVGRVVPLDAAKMVPTAMDCIDAVRDSIYNRAGSDCADEYFDGGLPKEKCAAIDADLSMLILSVFKAHGVDLQPDCFAVTDPEEHEIELPAAANDAGNQ